MAIEKYIIQADKRDKMLSKATASAKLIDFYSRRIWPIQRALVKKSLSRRCKRCILSENYAEIGEDNLCTYCRHNEPSRMPDKEEMDKRFAKILAESVNAGTWKYDAIVLFSGGKDSSLLVYKIQQSHPGLRLLALTVDNSFMSDIAMDNAKEMIEKLKVDHIVIRPNQKTMRKMYRYAFLHLNEKGCSGTVDQFDGDLLHDVARNMAARLEIPLIISGISRFQVQRILGLEWFETPADLEASKREKVAGLRLADIFRQDELRYWWDGTSLPKEKIPRMLFPYYVWDYDEFYIREEVVRLGLIPSGSTSPVVTNNQLIPLMGVVDYTKYGYSSFEPEFAQMIREKKTRRVDWLSTFELLEYAVKKRKNFLMAAARETLDRLEMTKEEVGLENVI